MIKEIYNTLNKNKKLIFMTLNIFFGVFLICVINIKYETNDDWYLSLISQGFFGQENSQYLIYSSVLLGYILKPLYLIFNTINWYVCLQLLLLSLSGYSIWKCSIRNKSFIFSLLINILFWMLVLIDAFNSVQYTKTAGIIAVVGLFAMYSSHKSNDKKLMILGFVLSFFGFLYRMNSFIFTLPFICILVLIDIVRNFKLDKKQSITIIKKIAIFAFILLFAFIFDKVHYNSSSWNEYYKFNNARTKIVDYNYLPYNENVEAYEEIAYSENDWKMMMEWLDDDINKFSGSELEYAIEQKHDDCSFIDIKGFIKFLIQNFKVNNTTMFISLLLLPLIVLFNKNSRLEAVLIILIGLLELLFLYYFGRYPDRVLYIVYSCIVVSFIYLLIEYKNINIKNNNMYSVLIISLLLCLANNVYNKRKVYSNDNLRFVDAIKDRDGKYIVDISYDNIEMQNEELPYIVSSLPSLENCDYIYSWIAGSPIVTSNRINRGFNKSPYSQLLNNDTYLITRTENHYKLIETYIRENYDSTIQGKYVDSIYCDDDVYLIYAYESTN